MNQRVTVIGAGRMGSALVSALFNKGFAPTVWNRSASKTEPLSRLGIRVAQSVLEAVSQADIVIVNINGYDSTRQLLRPPEIESALRGKVVVQLSSGAPKDARNMESWARSRGMEYLDGAIMSYPIDIGKAESTVLYSGSEELFNRIKPVLLAFGNNAMFVGKEIGQASAIDVAGLSFAMSAMLGFLHGYLVYEAENLPVEGYLEFLKSVMPTIEAMLADLGRKIRKKDYANTQASLDTWLVGPRELIGWCREHGVNHSLADAQLALMDKAIQSGKGQMDFAYLYETLKEG